MEKLVMTPHEAAKILQLSFPSMYDLCRSDGFPAIRVGRKILIPVDGLRRWLDAEANNGKQ